ncbi:hypothetical protein C8F01DRAFT_1086417 [Mycena amicta]|nr:hypothetical protein C8F01DRAFT_1086417 [Mycena amicta]
MSTTSLTSGSRLPDSASTSADALLFRRVLFGLLVPGAGFTTILLCLCAYAAWKPVSRKHLDRVSFRLLVYALLAQYTLVFFLVFCFTFPTINPRPGLGCTLRAFFANGSLLFSAGMFFCVAINLPLVLAHKVNGQRMEKFYVAGVMIVCLACNITPLAAGRLGFASGSCGYVSPPGTTLLKWVLSTQIVWMLAASVGEGHMFQSSTSLPAWLWDMGASGTQGSEPPTADLTRLQRDRVVFRRIVLRVGLYPFTACLLNITTSVIDLYLISDPLRTNQVRYVSACLSLPSFGIEGYFSQNIKVNIADFAIYCARPLIYGLLAATDPSFIRAMQALYRSNDGIETQRAQTRTVYPSTIVDIDYGSTSTELDGCEMDMHAVANLDTSTTTASVEGRKEEEQPPRGRVGRSFEQGRGCASGYCAGCRRWGRDDRRDGVVGFPD